MTTAQRCYTVVPRTERAAIAGLNTEQGHFEFATGTAEIITDSALAKDIEQRHGLNGTGEAWIMQDERAERHARNDSGTLHNYQFGSSRYYAQRWEQFERRRKAREENNALHTE
jgi:hypothetical protein